MKKLESRKTYAPVKHYRIIKPYPEESLQQRLQRAIKMAFKVKT